MFGDDKPGVGESEGKEKKKILYNGPRMTVDESSFFG
jgi:hypothetical protein